MASPSTTPARTVTSASSPGRASPRFTVALWAALLAAAALAWALTVRSWEQMGNGPGTMGFGLGGFIAVWTTMMAAMMLPAVAPVGSMYLQTIRLRASGATKTLRVGALLAGYLGVWASFGIAAYFAALGGGRLVDQAPSAGRWVAAGILLVAGLYQLTPLKDACLAHCRSPLGFLLHFGNYRGRLRDVRAGVYHGGYCVGCCWALFAVLVAVGIMNLAWMAGLALFVFLEKTWRHGKFLGLAVGAALIIYACLIPAFPELAPGLVESPSVVPGMEPAMQMDG
jgi:predicted metal-binding membrane protein